MKHTLSVTLLVLVLSCLLAVACSQTVAQDQSASNVVVEPVPGDTIATITAISEAATLPPEPAPGSPITPTEALTVTLPTVPPQPDDDAIPPAPAASVPEGLQPLLVATFDEQPDDWQRINLTFLPGEEGLWVSEHGMLAQKGLIQGGEAPVSRIPTLLLAPVTTGERSSIAVQVYPQDNQVIGLVFGASDTGFSLFRVSRSNGRMLQHYNLQTEEYTAFMDDPDGRGFEVHRWQELRIEQDGNVIQCFYDGEQVFEYRDARFIGGQPGVYTLAMGFVFFDNLTVAEP